MKFSRHLVIQNKKDKKGCTNNLLTQMVKIYRNPTSDPIISRAMESAKIKEMLFMHFLKMTSLSQPQI
jgi:hypothetical protein